MNPGVLGIPTPRVRHYDGVEQAFSAGATLVWEHGLGRVPTSWRVVLVCKTSENGYVAGDEIPAEYWWVGAATDANVPPAVATRVSRERISVKLHNNAGQVRSVTAAAGANSTVTPTTTNWTVKAYWDDVQPLA